jgi:hypothetical protein
VWGVGCVAAHDGEVDEAKMASVGAHVEGREGGHTVGEHMECTPRCVPLPSTQIVAGLAAKDGTSRKLRARARASGETGRGVRVGGCVPALA